MQTKYTTVEDDKYATSYWRSFYYDTNLKNEMNSGYQIVSLLQGVESPLRLSPGKKIEAVKENLEELFPCEVGG